MKCSFRSLWIAADDTIILIGRLYQIFLTISFFFRTLGSHPSMNRANIKKRYIHIHPFPCRMQKGMYSQCKALFCGCSAQKDIGKGGIPMEGVQIV